MKLTKRKNTIKSRRKTQKGGEYKGAKKMEIYDINGDVIVPEIYLADAFTPELRQQIFGFCMTIREKEKFKLSYYGQECNLEEIIAILYARLKLYEQHFKITRKTKFLNKIKIGSDARNKKIKNIQDNINFLNCVMRIYFNTKYTLDHQLFTMNDYYLILLSYVCGFTTYSEGYNPNSNLDEITIDEILMSLGKSQQLVRDLDKKIKLAEKAESIQKNSFIYGDKKYDRECFEAMLSSKGCTIFDKEDETKLKENKHKFAYNCKILLTYHKSHNFLIEQEINNLDNHIKICAEQIYVNVPASIPIKAPRPPQPLPRRPQPPLPKRPSSKRPLSTYESSGSPYYVNIHHNPTVSNSNTQHYYVIDKDARVNSRKPVSSSHEYAVSSLPVNSPNGSIYAVVNKEPRKLLRKA
jgi:hypothetical protein